jgi:acyl-coenzyme A synthetase/AMP-(fatty) acid ligase
MKRTKLSSLAGKYIMDVQFSKTGDFVQIRTWGGMVMLTARVDDLFDSDGNRFVTDDIKEEK